jgi:hypothetical protein
VDPTGKTSLGVRIQGAALEYALIVSVILQTANPVELVGKVICTAFKFYDYVVTAISLERGLIDHEWDSGPSNWDIFWKQAEKSCDLFAG